MPTQSLLIRTTVAQLVAQDCRGNLVCSRDARAHQPQFLLIQPCAPQSRFALWRTAPNRRTN